MKIEEGKIYRGGKDGQRQTVKKVVEIDTRASGTTYVKWVNIRKNGTEGATGWARYETFKQWSRKVEG